MKKFCVFCGERPVSKTMEHVIPRWLIEATGDRNRRVPLGVDPKTGQTREYAFDQLKFPACASCNSDFGSLESRTKVVVFKVLREQALSADSLGFLLSWFDKVRIGLWLGFLLLNRNPFGISPHFHIERRIDATDRMLLIYRVRDTEKGVQFYGVGTPFFDHCPACFGMAINQFYFVSIATDFLFSRRLGLPYPTEKVLSKEGKAGCRIVKGMERIICPLIRKGYDRSCTEIYQPIIRRDFLKNDKLMRWYDNAYVKRFVDVESSNLGKILMSRENRIVEYSAVPGTEWIPRSVHDRSKLGVLFRKQVILLQNFLIDDFPTSEDFEARPTRLKKKLRATFKGYNAQVLKEIDKSLWGR